MFIKASSYRRGGGLRQADRITVHRHEWAGGSCDFSPERAAAIAPHFLAVHAFVFIIPRPVASENQEHRMHRSVVAVNPALTQRVGWRSISAVRDNDEEMKMRLLGKTAIVLGMAGAMALGSMTASEARNGRNAAIAVGAGAFVAGAAIGAAAANANAGYYYGSGYGYDSYAYQPTYVAPAYDSYAYEPTYVAPAYTAPSYYGPVRTYGYSGYNTNYTGPWSERRLMGLD